MTTPDDTQPTFAAGYVIHFRDGGPPEEQVLVTGTEDSCEAMRRRMPGVAYSGARPVERAEWVMVRTEASRG